MVEVTTKDAAAKAAAVRNGELPGPARNIAEAMARIYADGGRYVQKTGQMQGVARYSYAKEGDFIAALRPLMEVHGVTVSPVQMDVLFNESFERKNGGTAYRVVVLVTFRFLHSSGESIAVQTIGEGQDSGDKAFNKAMTAAMKYALRQSFCVETGDDPDDTPSHEQERAAPARHQAPAPRDNLQLRAQRVQQFAQCKTRDDFKAASEQVRASADQGLLSATDLAAIRAAAEETKARLWPAA